MKKRLLEETGIRPRGTDFKEGEGKGEEVGLKTLLTSSTEYDVRSKNFAFQHC